MKFEELELLNVYSEDPFSNTLKLIRFANDDGSYPCNHGLAYSLCNTESDHCYLCLHDKIISKLNIGAPVKRGIEFPIFWTAHTKKFRIDKVDITDIDQQEINKFASFCARSNLENFAINKFQDFRLSLLIVNHENENVGFSIYSSNIPDDDFDRRMVINFMEQEGWVPENEENLDFWFVAVFEWIETIYKRGSRYENPDDIPEDKLSAVLDSLKDALFSPEVVLSGNLEDIAKWIYTYEPPPQKPNVNKSVIKMDLVCADQKLAGYGILDNVLLTLQKEALHIAKIHGLGEAYIKLIPADARHEARYRVAGFFSGDDEFFWTKNLVKFPLS